MKPFWNSSNLNSLKYSISTLFSREFIS
jgi:hypothetical protein